MDTPREEERDQDQRWQSRGLIHSVSSLQRKEGKKKEMSLMETELKRFFFFYSRKVPSTIRILYLMTSAAQSIICTVTLTQVGNIMPLLFCLIFTIIL